MITLPSNKKLIIAAIFTVICIIISIVFFTINTKSAKKSALNKSIPAINISPTQRADTENKSAVGFKEFFPPTQKIAKIGNETIYGGDLNSVINARFPSDIILKKTPEELKSRALNEAVEDSILLQEEKKVAGLDISTPVFDTPSKNYIARQKLISEIKNRRLASEEKISGAFISVWYHNVKPPAIPLPDAQKLAFTKIQQIYNDIKTGSLSFEQAGQIVKNDETLAQIDKNYRGNAYYEFKDRTTSSGTFVYDDLESKLWQMEEGQISEIIQHPANQPLGKRNEEFYGIIKVTRRINKGNGSYSDWLKREKQKYGISVF